MEQNMPNTNRIYHGDKEIHQRIQNLINESGDPEFTRFLNQLGNALWQGHVDDMTARNELDRAYSVYQQNMQRKKQMTPEYIYPGNVEQISEPVVPRKRNVEFTVGAGVLGVTGAIFMLVAFVIFAMNFMSGLVKGICLYAIAAAVILISELIVRKRQERFALGMTGAGISGLFLCTIINYTYLHIFNSVVAFVLIGITAIVAFIFSYKKASGILRIIALLGSVVCLFPMISYENEIEYAVTCGMVILIQLVAAFVPSKNESPMVRVWQMIVQCISLIMICVRAADQSIDNSLERVFVVLMIALLNILFTKAKIFTGSVVAYCVIYFINIVALPMGMLEYPNWLYSLLPLACITIIFTLLIKHPKCRWIPYWFYNGIVLSSVYENSSADAYKWMGFICILLLFVWAKVCSKVKALHISECILSIITFVYLLGINEGNCGTENISTVMLLILTICFIISVLAVNYWHAFYEVLITGATIICVFKLVPEMVRLPIITGILILSIFLFSLLRKGKAELSIKIYNIMALCIIAGCYIAVIFVESIYIYLAMLLFGITLFVFLFEDKYKLQTRHKGLWIGCFLTYMFLVLDTEYPIINSVLLAATAILCVATGFISRTKPVRIYGIVMAIIVAVKVAVFDFMGMATMQRMLTFLIVGILILVISYLYILLEKKIGQDDN